MCIENGVDDIARSRLCKGPVNASTHMDNIDKQPSNDQDQDQDQQMLMYKPVSIGIHLVIMPH